MLFDPFEKMPLTEVFNANQQDVKELENAIQLKIL